VQIAAKSHKGLVRAINEDSILAKPHLYGVADGMGGHKAGEVASSIAIMRLNEMDVSEDLSVQEIEALLKQTILKINAELCEMGNKAEYDGMGTTLTCLVLQNNISVIGHVGDSRAYLFRDNDIIRITQDHSVTREHPYRNILTRALGTEPVVEIDLHVLEVREGDWIMLCTDGLTAVLDEKEILSILIAGDSPQAIVDNFINIVNDRGGPDNTSLVLIRIDDNS
jgi:protein phosphatase